MDIKDTYKTVETLSKEVLFKDKKSKFYGYVFPLTHKDEVKPLINSLKKKHHTANHVCYAWQLGVETIQYRANDDGEPNNSAGMPIYGQIQSFGVTNVLVAIVRFFGGTKLGVGGLISAYRNSAQLALESVPIIEKTLEQYFLISFDYQHMNNVMRIINEHQITIVSKDLQAECNYVIAVRKQQADKIEAILSSKHYIKLEKRI